MSGRWRSSRRIRRRGRTWISCGSRRGRRRRRRQWWERALGALDANGGGDAAVGVRLGGAVLPGGGAVAAGGTDGAGGDAGDLPADGGYAGGCLWEANGQATKAVVIAKSTQAREAPADVAPVADTLPAGSEVLAPEERGPWTYCTLPDGTRAWVPTDALEKVRG